MLRLAMSCLLLLAACTPTEPPLLLVSKQVLAFGTVEVNAGAFRQPLALTNVGTSALRITTLRLETDSPELELVGGPVERLEGGERVKLAVVYRPTTKGTVSGVLHLEASDGQGPRTLLVSGTAGRLAAELTVGGNGRCGTTPSSLDFGTVTNGVPASREFTIASTGTAPITVLQATLTPADRGFELTGPFGQPIAPGERATYRVAYDPRVAGPQAVGVSLTTNSSLQPKLTVSLCGTGLVEALCVSPREFDLGTVTSGASQTAMIQVTSCGNLPVTLNDVALVNVNSTPGFSLPNVPTLPRVMPEGDAFSLQVRFDSLSALSARSLVRLTTSSPVTPTVEVAVGANLPPPCTVSLSPNPLSFFNVVPAAPVRVTNLGARDCVMQRLSIVQAGSAFTLERTIEVPAVLPAHASMEIPIRYAPGTAPETATLELEFDFVRELKLKGDPTPPPGCRLLSLQREVDFGQLAPDAPAKATVTLLNAGRDPCELTGATVNEASLSVDLPQQQLDSRATLTLEVSHTPPSSTSPLRGELTIASNDLTRPELVLSIVAANLYCDAQCQCTDDQTLAHWRFTPGLVGSSVAPSAGPGAIRRSCEPQRCEQGQVLVEVGRRNLRCVPPPPDCGPDGLDYINDRWQCVPCELVVQFGGLFDGLRSCAPAPDLTCGPGRVPTFDAITHTWDCAMTCDNGLYDQRLLAGQLVCVPC